MNWITEDILIGNYVEAQNPDMLRGAEIKSIVGLDGKLRSWQTEELGVDRIEVFNLIDGPGNDPHQFRQIVNLVVELCEKNPSVLVHCHAGRSRSPTVVAGYFMVQEGLTPRQAISRVGRKQELDLTNGIEEPLESLL